MEVRKGVCHQDRRQCLDNTPYGEHACCFVSLQCDFQSPAVGLVHDCSTFFVLNMVANTILLFCPGELHPGPGNPLSEPVVYLSVSIPYNKNNVAEDTIVT